MGVVFFVGQVMSYLECIADPELLLDSWWCIYMYI
jgi:hypothetical protein